MSGATIYKADGRRVSVRDDAHLVKMLDSTLAWGEKVTVVVAKRAASTIAAVSKAMEENGVHLTIDQEGSDPKALDYILGTALGASIGAAGGAAVGLVGYYVLREVATTAFPPLKAVVLGATAIGAVIGACSGAAVVHWRVRVRLTVGDAIELEFQPS